MTNKIIIGAASNERYFPGLFAMVTSVLINTKTKYEIEFHIIDGGILSNSFEKLNYVIRKIDSNAKIIKHEVDLKSFDSFPKDFGGGVLTYARLLFPTLLPNISKMIYLDSDILFMKDISELWDITIEEQVLAVCQDPLMKYVSEDCTILDKFNIPEDGLHFNAGIMKMNLKLWRELNITEKTIEYIKSYPEQCRFWDQSALNIILFNKVLFLDKSFNYFSDHYNLLPSDKHAYNIHFLMSKKPWLYYHVGLAYDLFYKIMEVLKIELNDDVYLQSKKYNKLKFKFLEFYLFVLKSKLFLVKLIHNEKMKSYLINAILFWEQRKLYKNNKGIKILNNQALIDWEYKLKILNECK